MSHLILFLLLPTLALASGPQVIRARQDADCGVIASYELAWQDVVGAGAEPGTGAAFLSFSPPTPFVCPADVVTTQPITGIGPRRFWMRAIMADGTTRSTWSNAVEASVPFSRPVLVSVGN